VGQFLFYPPRVLMGFGNGGVAGNAHRTREREKFVNVRLPGALALLKNSRHL